MRIFYLGVIVFLASPTQRMDRIYFHNKNKFGIIVVILILFLFINPSNILSTSLDNSLSYHYKNQDYLTIIDHFSALQNKKLSPAENYLLFNILLKTGKHNKAANILKKMPYKKDWYYRWIYYAGRIDQYGDSKNLLGLIRFVLSVDELRDIPYFQKKISRTFEKIGLEYSTVESTKIDMILNQNHYLRKSPIFLLEYLKIFTKSGPQRNKILQLLWMNGDVNEIDSSVAKEMKRKSVDWLQVAEVANQHFEIQIKNENFKYLEKLLPEHLLRKNIINISDLYTLRNRYFKSLIRRKKIKHILAIVNSQRLKKAFALNDLDALDLKFRGLLKSKDIHQIKKVLHHLEQKLSRKKIQRYYLQISTFFKQKGFYDKSLYYHEKIDVNLLGTDKISDFHWFRFMLYIRTNNLQKAKQLASNFSKLNLKSARVSSHFCYWDQKLNSSRTPNKCFEEFPSTFYGFRSKLKTFVLSKKDLKRGRIPKQIKSEIKGEIFSMIRVLYLTENGLLAELLINKQIKQVDQTEKRKFIQFLGSIQQYKLMLNFGYRYFPPDGNLEIQISSQENWKYIYPLAYPEEIKKMSANYKVPEFLIEAVIREESRYFSEAESISGALGLMQLMPKTATYVARKIKEKIKLKQLFDPEINIKLGVAYLEYLLRKYKGNLVYTLAAYNGGPTNVRRWRKKNRGDDIDMFLETIPFAETKGYVKKVLRSYFLYQEIYD